jgi:hypothetical protein
MHVAKDQITDLDDERKDEGDKKPGGIKIGVDKETDERQKKGKDEEVWGAR